MVYDAVFDNVFSHIDPEVAHEQAFAAIRLGGPALRHVIKVPKAPRTVMGIEFPHAFGLAAGFDKNAKAVPGLLGLGFGHVEIGTVTARPQPGNPKPRLFRLLDDRAVVNRMGFNNDGAAVVAGRLHRLRRTRVGRNAVIGVNIGKTKATPVENAVADYVESARLLAPFASYLVVNVSSPNTPGLRDLQAVDELRPLLTAVKAVTDAARRGARAFRWSSRSPRTWPTRTSTPSPTSPSSSVWTASAPPTRRSSARSRWRQRRRSSTPRATGGLSGPVLRERSLEVLVRLRERVGDRLALIGVGGVTTPDDVRERLSAGADLVQAYTGFIYGGPAWPATMARAAR